jgi:hypothetical protein
MNKISSWYKELPDPTKDLASVSFVTRACEDISSPSLGIPKQEYDTPLITVTSWNTLSHVVKYVLERQNLSLPTVVFRMFSHDRCPTVLSTGTDRDETSLNWLNGPDATSELQQSRGITSGRLIYALTIDSTSLPMRHIPLLPDEYKEKIDGLPHPRGDGQYSAVALYNPHKMTRASEVEYWFECDPREALLAVIRKAEPQESVRRLDPLALEEIGGRLGIAPLQVSIIVNSMRQDLRWEESDGLSIAGSSTHHLWQTSRVAQIGFIPGAASTHENDQSFWTNNQQHSNQILYSSIITQDDSRVEVDLTFTRSLDVIAKNEALATKATYRHMKSRVFNELFNHVHGVYHLGEEDKIRENPFVELPRDITKEDPRVRKEHEKMFFLLHPGAEKLGVQFHTLDTIFILRKNSNSDQLALQLKALGYEYVYEAG